MQNKILNKMIKISLLAVIAFLLMLIEIALPIFPSFLKIDLSDLPVLIGSFVLGPIAGVTIELIKNIIHLLMLGSTGGIGELANFVVGGTFAAVAGFIYSKNKTNVGAIIGLVVGVLAMTLVAPFNLLKGVILSIVNFLVFKKVGAVISKN